MAESLTLQQIFDKVATHLLAQGARSTANDGGSYCAYRGFSGRMCAAGCLILDEHYDPILEGRGAHSERVEAALVASGVVGEDSHHLVRSLQCLHDSANPSEWRDRLVKLAARYELNADAVAL